MTHSILMTNGKTVDIDTTEGCIAYLTNELQGSHSQVFSCLGKIAATISSQGARIAELEEFVKRVDMGEYENYINIKLVAKHLKEAQS